jgi:hypothetical protein
MTDRLESRQTYWDILSAQERIQEQIGRPAWLELTPVAQARLACAELLEIMTKTTAPAIIAP